MARPGKLRVQLCRREMHQSILRESCLLFALALLSIVLFPSFSAAQGRSLTTSTGASSEMRSGTAAAARFPVIDGSDIRFSRLSTAQGLSQTRVAQLVQDDTGFMWFGTQYGLDRYDGYEFRVFTHDSARKESLSCVYIHSLFKDRSGMLWVGCDQFLDRFDSVHEIFTHYRIDTGAVANYVTEITQDRTGVLWLATGNGLFGLNPDTGRLIHYVHDSTNPSSLGSNQIRCTLEDRDGRFWVADGENLEAFDRTNGRVLSRTRLNEGTSSLYEDHLGVLWVTYVTSTHGSGLAVFDRSTGRLIPYSLYDQRSGQELPAGFMAVVEDKNKTLWLASFGGGLLKLDRKHRVFIRYRNHPGNLESLADDRVIALCEDREGNVWVGLHASEPNFFRTETAPFIPLPLSGENPRSHGERFVNAIYEDRGGLLWTATTGALNRINRRSGESTSYQPPGQGPGDVVTIAEDRAGALWVGTFGAGLSQFDRRTGNYKTYRHEPSNRFSLSSNIVSRLLVDHAGAMWVATYNGLDRFDSRHEKFVVYKQDSKNEDEEYFNLAEDQNGFLWMGSWAGLNRFDPNTGQFTIYAHKRDDPRSLSDNAVTSVYVDHSGTLWASTENGLNKLDRDTGTFTHYYVKDGLPSNAVSCVLEDQFGMLWMSTNRGLSRFDPTAKRFTNYSTVDGLPGNDFTGWDACFKSPSGEMFFGGFAGGVAFFPDKVINTSYPLPLVLTDLQLAGHSVEVGRRNSPLTKSISYSTDIKLTHDQSIFSLSFAALTYFNPDTNRYRYKLDELDHDWIEAASDRRVASFTTLPAGKYTFHVQSATRQGLWNEPGLALGVTILPPWWDTFWFRSSCVVAAVSILWMLYILRLKHMESEIRARLEERLGERDRIARELHDTLLQGIQGLILRFQAVAERIPSSEPAHQMIEKALDRADEVLVQGRDRVKNLRVASQTNALPDAFADAFKDLALSQGAEFCVVVEGDLRKLNPLVRDEAYWIGHEALVNALHHAGAKRIEVEIAYDPSHLRLRFRDDGCGIDPKIIEAGGKPGHWGMRGMRERAAKIGAHFETWSRPGAGTELELKILGSVAYSAGGNGSPWRRLRQLWHEEIRHDSHQSSNG